MTKQEKDLLDILKATHTEAIAGARRSIDSKHFRSADTLIEFAELKITQITHPRHARSARMEIRDLKFLLHEARTINDASYYDASQ